MFDTKIAIVLRKDLATWQKLNVTAFLITGIIGQNPELIGEPYVDAAGNEFNPMCIQPMIVLECEGAKLSTIHNRAINRGVKSSAYTEEMFSTGHDEANREVFGQFGPEDAKMVGIAVRADKKLVDKITKGAKMAS